MPGYDGTGPNGHGPMTGCCKGFCTLKVPKKPFEPLVGFIGREAKPVSIWPYEMGKDLIALHTRLFKLAETGSGEVTM